jgi:hypothetical protein
VLSTSRCIWDHVAVRGRARAVAIASVNTWLDAGGWSGSVKAGELATDSRDGTVLPVSARIVCPSTPIACTMNRQAASTSPAAARQ